MLVLCLAGGWAYANSFDGVFLYDDIPAIVDNTSIRSLWPLSRPLHPPPDTTVSGRPVTNLSFALNYALSADAAGGLPTWSFHAVNLAIHVLAAVALFSVVRRTLLTARLRERFGTDATSIALACALIWIVHPLHTQAVTYIVQRAESLMGLCYLLTLYCAIRAVEPGRPTGMRWVMAALAVCVTGMLAKEIMIGVPLIVWIWLRLFGTPDAVPAVIRRTLIAGLVASTAVPIIIAMTTDTQGAVALRLVLAPDASSPVPASAYQGWNSWNYLLTQSGVLVHYLRLSMLPSPLIFDYYDWPQIRSFQAVAPQALALAAAAVMTALGVVTRAPWSMVGAWFFITLGPSSSLIPIPTEVAAEHRMYLPLAAVVVLAVIGAHRFASGAGAPPRFVTIVVIAALAFGLGRATRIRNADYGSAERLWHDTVRKRPGNARARINYGLTQLTAGRLAASEEQMRAAISLQADGETAAQALVQLGSALAAQGRVDESVAYLERALVLDPRAWEAHMILGQASSERGDFVRAVEHLKRAVEANPREVLLLNRLVWILATAEDSRARDGRLAVELGQRALAETDQRNVSTWVSLGAAYAEAGRFPEAAAAATHAMGLARAAGDAETARTIEVHLEHYADRRPLRLTPYNDGR